MAIAPDSLVEKNLEGTVPAGRRTAFTLKPSRQTCIALAALMGVVFLSGAGVYAWQSGVLEAKQTRLDAKLAEVAGGEKIARRFQSTEADYAASQDQLRNLETTVSAGEYVPTLLRQMEGLARSVHLQVGAIRPKLEPAPPAPADKEARKKWTPWPYDKIHIDMEVRGSYWNLAKLLYRLTEFPKILAVESVQVQPGPAADAASAGVAGGGQAAPVLTANLRLCGFIFPDDGKTARPAAAAHASGIGLPQAPPVINRMGAHAHSSTSVVEGSPPPPPAR